MRVFPASSSFWVLQVSLSLLLHLDMALLPRVCVQIWGSGGCGEEQDTSLY